jgi:hypothetical protein
LTWPVAGLVLGELLASSNISDDSLELTPAATCASTLSFSIGRAAALYPNFSDWPMVLQGWEVTREITRQRSRFISGSAIAEVCATVLHAAQMRGAAFEVRSSRPSVLIACQQFILNPERAPEMFVSVPEFRDADAQMYGSREDRVVALLGFMKGMPRLSGLDSEIRAFMLGYLTSRIAPGTIQHSNLITAAAKDLPTAFMWYGFCAGFGGSDNGVHALDRRGGVPELPASARRIVRDMLRPEVALGSPNCDISLLELMALSRTGSDPLSTVVRSTQGTAAVEIFPHVLTTVNVSSKSMSDADARPTLDRHALASIGEYIERLRLAYDHLVANERYDREDGQGEMFGPKRRKR